MPATIRDLKRSIREIFSFPKTVTLLMLSTDGEDCCSFVLLCFIWIKMQYLCRFRFSPQLVAATDGNVGNYPWGLQFLILHIDSDETCCRTPGSVTGQVVVQGRDLLFILGDP